MTDAIRISAEETRRKVLSGAAILVCSYEEHDKFIKNRLEGALSFSEFRDKLASLSKEVEIIFYCS